MAFSLVAHGTDGTGTLTKPSGLADGELVVWFVNASAAGATLPGHRKLYEAPPGGTQTTYAYVFARHVVSAAGEPSSVTLSGATVNGSVWGRFTGHDPRLIVSGLPAVSNGGGATSAPVAPAVTPFDADALLLCGVTWWDNVSGHTEPSGMTLVDNDIGGAGDDATGAFLAISGGANSSTGTKTFAPSGSQWVTGSVALAPVIAGIAISSSLEEHGTSLGSSNAQVLPDGSAAGDLVLYIVGNDNTSTTALTASTGWTALTNAAQTQGSNVIKSNVFGRILDGTTGDNICSITGAAQDYVVVGVRIAAADHGVTSVASIVCAGAVSSSNGNTNPPNCNPGTSAAYLWLACAIVDLTTGNTITALPANYAAVENAKSASSTSSVAVAVAVRRLTASAEDPGTFTNTSRPWIGLTIAIPPAAGGVTGTAAVTMGAVVSAAAGTPVIVGTAAVTMGAVVSAAAGTPVIVGTAAVTMGAVVPSSTGGQVDVGTAAVTMGAVVSNGQGTPVIVGTAAVTMGAVVSSGSGQPAGTAGTAAVTMGAVVSNGQGTPVIVGAAAVALGAIVSTATGGPAGGGAGATVLGAVVSNGQGTPVIVGQAAIGTGAVVSNGAGTPVIVGVAAILLGAIVSAAQGAAGDGSVLPVAYWSGAVWVPGVVKVWDGAGWVAPRVRYWNGAVWVP